MNWQLTLFISFLFLSILFKSDPTMAQDERFYRKIFTGNLRPSKSQISQMNDFKNVISSSIYKVDLNRDGVDEGIILEKKDGNDYIKIVDNIGRSWFEYRLETLGTESKVYKIMLKSLTKDSDVLIVHFYEGAIESSVFEASARLYFISIDKRDLKSLKIFKGPHYWHEKEVGYKYWNRFYNVNVFDYNKDGRKEISVNYNKIARIYFYLGYGRWKRL